MEGQNLKTYSKGFKGGRDLALTYVLYYHYCPSPNFGDLRSEMRQVSNTQTQATKYPNYADSDVSLKKVRRK